ncbi:MAG: hypothetical protein AAF298_04445 [Cyanobacteria bacterium P01_A01_bin.40]
MVVIRGYEEPNGFLEAAKRQVEKLNIKTDLKLICKKGSLCTVNHTLYLLKMRSHPKS